MLMFIYLFIYYFQLPEIPDKNETSQRQEFDDEDEEVIIYFFLIKFCPVKL